MIPVERTRYGGEYGGALLPLVERRLKGRKRVPDTWCIRTTLRKNSMEASNVTETNRENGGRREWGAVRWADDLPGLQKSCLFQGYHTPQQKGVIWLEIQD